LVTLQNNLVDNFFNAVVEQFNVLGSPFDKTKINNFDNNGECQREIDVFKQLAAADAAACKAQCGNVKLAADCLHGKVRDLLRAEQTKAAGETSTPRSTTSTARSCRSLTRSLTTPSVPRSTRSPTTPTASSSRSPA
jgi:hypothetical protein